MASSQEDGEEGGKVSKLWCWPLRQRIHGSFLKCTPFLGVSLALGAPPPGSGDFIYLASDNFSQATNSHLCTPELLGAAPAGSGPESRNLQSPPGPSSLKLQRCRLVSLLSDDENLIYLPTLFCVCT